MSVSWRVEEKSYRPGRDFKHFPVKSADAENCARACEIRYLLVAVRGTE
jgi:hypothetical protein